MKMRTVASKYGHPLYCHRNICQAKVTQHHSMQQAIQSFSRDEQRAVMQWLTQNGPFWDEYRIHSSEDYLECNGAIVTDAAVGEAAYSSCNGHERHLVSIVPSKWGFSPISVQWMRDNQEKLVVEVINYWDVNQLEMALRSVPTPLQTWKNLAEVCISRNPRLNFLDNCFEPLDGIPFSNGTANRIIVLLDTLEKLKNCVNDQGQRTAEGHHIISEHFSGGKSWFSDSSLTEKQEFKTKLTFKNPLTEEDMSCTWHGKVKTPQIRIHFSDPFSSVEPIYVAYVGMKITRN